MKATPYLIHAVGATGDKKKFWYDPVHSTLNHENGARVAFQPLRAPQPAHEVPFPRVSEKTPGAKAKRLKKLKIQLGLACNYECGYCNQSHVKRPVEETTPQDVDPFMAQLSGAGIEAGDEFQIEFWGGEPLVYWKTLKPLAQVLRVKYPLAKFLMITNGSLLDEEKNNWLVDNNFTVAISHDAHAQGHRGPDPLEDQVSRIAILDLFHKLHASGRISFNTMIHKGNTDRARVARFFQALTGREDVGIGEGNIIDAYDEKSQALLFESEQHYGVRAQLYGDIASGAAKNFSGVTEKFVDFVQSVANGRLAKTLGQRCAMDRGDHLAVDLHGHVLTCQNMSHVAVAPNGQPHKLGHLNDYSGIRLKSATHWSFRKDCSTCPVLQICQGSCMFLQGDLFAASCESAYSAHLATFAAAFEYMTLGYKPVYIDSEDLPEHRKDVWGIVKGAPPPAMGKKPFPIPVVSASAPAQKVGDKKNATKNAAKDTAKNTTKRGC